jgi:hypothetical protein
MPYAVCPKNILIYILPSVVFTYDLMMAMRGRNNCSYILTLINTVVLDDVLIHAYIKWVNRILCRSIAYTQFVYIST